MKNKFTFILLFVIIQSIFSEDIYFNYALSYGEGPLGQYLIGFKTYTYSQEDSVYYAKKEIMEFLSGMIYGYSFVYKVENNITHSKGFFDLTSLAKINEKDKNLSLRQIEKSDMSIRLQAIYRLNDDQKSYIRGFQSSLAKMSMGEASESWVNTWDKRLEVYKKALRDSVLNEARKKYKSRPLYIKGKLLLKENPVFIIVSGEWKVRVEVHIIISKVNYKENY